MNLQVMNLPDLYKLSVQPKGFSAESMSIFPRKKRGRNEEDDFIQEEKGFSITQIVVFYNRLWSTIVIMDPWD